MADPVNAQRFEKLVLPHMNSAFNVARWLTHNDQDAQDVVQEAYLRAFRFFGGFRGEDARAWLLSIVRNTFYTWHQQNRGHAADTTEFEEDMHSLETSTAEHDDSPEAMLIRSQSQKRVHKALQSLRLEYREVVVLRELEELSYKEIAAIVGIPMGTVMSRLGRGRQQLAALLAPTDQEA
ncbi:sigma-70 family RNA polymerase sigma factor [Caballeronia sp. SEWSISQ10-4 2]|uniref:RNA polymerase sigma factor n=1 Tax=Caballeronia udeis TaxID=1232866 RepID=A0A158J5K9_9BURK|nr:MULTISPECIES: sigma-70 family RNA polymerase sigma factor [Caballeronia]MDN7179139.1 sigma-70 family RNA polymerase sigma factor [Caballeronia sp. SEWSISQ10-4 2]SAL64116.1 RNA polymerase sigma factor [Caballeronia udeis]